ncbi:tRNA guanosine(34) transglycosylase Tgt [Myxococcota bacterium]|nr:tRNA guanosine(34) transglycosylase Tgt [Myxococcota bacterium]
MRASGFAMEIVARDGLARSARITTPHGVIPTPIFMPVATFGAVRGIGPGELAQAGAEILLSNTYHLHERPGEETVAALGGLHGFTGWRGPWLTDSGGFQITSLADRAHLDEEGVTFQSSLDGRRRKLTPESAIAIQEALGADIAMVLDECLPVATGDNGRTDPRALESALERTLRWAARSQAARRRADQAVFAIVQGGADPALRRRSAEQTAALDFDGHAHGGLGLGETREERRAAIHAAHAVLPADRPRYLMGLGRPIDLLDGVAEGIDLFDCVVPTRNGRHGLVYTSQGTLHLRNASFERDPSPIDPSCACPACANHSRGYLRHLLRSGESLGARLSALHNLTYYLNLMKRARTAIGLGRFAELHAEIEAIG